MELQIKAEQIKSKPTCIEWECCRILFYIYSFVLGYTIYYYPLLQFSFIFFV